MQIQKLYAMCMNIDMVMMKVLLHKRQHSYKSVFLSMIVCVCASFSHLFRAEMFCQDPKKHNQSKCFAYQSS